MIQKMQQAPKPHDQGVIARRAGKSALLTANRAERGRHEADKDGAMRMEAEREAAAQAIKLVDAECRKREDGEKIIALLAEEKAASDARYAARKKGKA